MRKSNLTLSTYFFLCEIDRNIKRIFKIPEPKINIFIFRDSDVFSSIFIYSWVLVLYVCGEPKADGLIYLSLSLFVWLGSINYRLHSARVCVYSKVYIVNAYMHRHIASTDCSGVWVNYSDVKIVFFSLVWVSLESFVWKFCFLSRDIVWYYIC